jgi:hypothetical protein
VIEFWSMEIIMYGLPLYTILKYLLKIEALIHFILWFHCAPQFLFMLLYMLLVFILL